MTDNDKCCPPPKEVQDFLFKQASVSQICEEFQKIPTNSSLIAADVRRGLVYIGQDSKLIIVKPKADSNPEWKFEINLQDQIYQVGLSCDCSLLAVTFDRSSALIYDTNSIDKHKLNLLHKVRLSTSGKDVSVFDLKWNPAIPEMFCSVTSDHTVACFQVSKDKTNVQIIGMEKAPGLEALCVSWSPKGKQIVVGCKNGDIVQLKPELKMARHLQGPNPSEGMIISILWVSNYQFCACFYHPSEPRISVMIADAPKGAIIPRFTNYEDVTFGSGPTDNICYYFEHISEWGVIIVASSHSSEVSVLGTSDNGTTWNLWQLMDDSTAQLPLNRKKKIENYPVGMAIDKSITQRLPWGSENTLPNSFPVLRILVTSGQLCSYHMVNLKENAAVICTPPTEFIPAPELPKPSIAPAEVSFNLSTGATSTPRMKQNIPEAQIDKPKLATNIFGNTSNTVFSFLPPSNKTPTQIAPQTNVQNIGLPELVEVKTSLSADQGDGKINLIQQDNINKAFTLQIDERNKPKQILQPVITPSEPKSIGQPLKLDNKPEFKTPVASASNQAEVKLNKETVKEPTQKSSEEAKEMPVYDEGVCLRAYYEEQARFEKELKSRLDLPSWNCGTEEERQILIKKTNDIDEFLRELKETTNSLASDIAYLKALLLQSFAWVEETKSKNSSSSLSTRSRIEGSKLSDLQRLYYYTQSQLIQATKVLDLEWAEHHDRKLSRMKIPSLEMIYQSLIRYSQIIDKEKKNIDELTKKWRSIERGNNVVNSLDRSMASLDLSQSSNMTINDTAISLRCKLIATNFRNLSRDKQLKLRDLLSESAPTIVRAVRPTAIQDRLEATLSSLAALKTTETTPKTSKVVKPMASKTPTEQIKVPSPNSLSSLNSLVSGIGTSPSPLSRSPSSVAPFSSFGTKSTPLKLKENVTQQQTQMTLETPKAITQSLKESPILAKPAASNTPVSVPAAAATSKFPSFSTPKSTSSFPTSTATTAPASFAPVPKLDASIPFKFSTKPVEQSQTSIPEATLDFSGLSFDPRPGAVTSLFAKSPPVTTTTISKVPPSPAVTATGVLASPTSILPSPSGSTAANPVSTAPTSVFGTSTMFGALSSSSATPSLNFKLPPLATSTAATGNLPVTATTSACPPSIPFGGAPSTAPSSMPSFAGILGSTSSLSFGSPTTTTSIAPAFSKSSTAPVTNIFGSAATPTTSLFGKTESSTAAVSTPSSPSVFSSAVSTASGSLTFGSQLTSNASGNSFFGSKATPTTAPSTSIFDASASTTASTTSIFGSSSGGAGGSNANLPIFATANNSAPKSNVFEVSNAAQSSGTSIFGGTATTQSSSIPVFGSSGTTQSSGTSVFGTASNTQASIFGNGTTQSNAAAVFGNTSTAQTSASTGFFASSTTQSTVTSPFSGGTTQSIATSPFASGATQSNGGTSVFGGTGTAPSSTPVFGSTNATIASPLFKPATVTTTTLSTTTATSPGIFGTPAAAGTSSIFSGGAATPFSSNTTPGTSIFGAGTSQPVAGNLFGAAASNTGASQPTTGGLFGAGAAGTAQAQPAMGNLFGSGTAGASQPTTGNLFGAGTASAGTGQPAAGGLFGAGAASAATGQPATGNVFGAAAANTGSPVFGGPPTLGAGTSMFGGAAVAPGGGMGSTSVFGQPSAFGAKPVFGSPATDFGAAKQGFTSGFSSPPAFGSSSGAVFGSPSLLGTGSPLAGTSPNKVFGSSTFEALGAQSGGLSFDSLAQKTPGTEKPQAFQGSSSFSSWR